MGWLWIIVLAVVIEGMLRMMTRGMEDKKKREKILALVWVVFGFFLIVVWLVMR